MKKGVMRGKLTDVQNSIRIGGRGASFEEGVRPAIQNSVMCEAFGFSGTGGGFMGTLGGPLGGLPGYPGGAGSPQQLSDSTTLFGNLRWYPISNFRQLLSQLYLEIGLIKTVVDVPVDDALRGGVKIKSKKLSEDQISDLKISMERDNDLGQCGQAAKWNRLFGGGGIIVIVGDQDPESPLDMAAIGPDTDIEFRAVDMWELYWSQQNTEGYDAQLDDEQFEYYDYYNVSLHKSRVLKLKGMVAPSFVRPQFRGWGVSIVENLVRSVNQYLKSNDLAFEVMDEFKVDVFKIKNLVNTLLNPNGMQQIRNRVQLANWQKDFQNALVIDGDDDWDHKQLSFSGLGDTMKEIRKQVAADLRMPITKLFGSSDSSASIGTADQNDMENYNSMIESEIRTKLKQDVVRLIEIKCQKLFKFIPDDLEIEFEPLRVLSATDEETVKTQKFTRVFQAKQAGELTTEEFRDTCNKGNLFDIKLDTSAAALGEVEDVQDEMAEDSAAEGDDDEKTPKPDKADSRSVKNSLTARRVLNSKGRRNAVIRCWRVGA